GDVGEHALDGIWMEVTPAHLDDRTEAAIERAPARGFHHVDAPAQQRVVGEDPRVTVWQPQRVRGQREPRAVAVVGESVARPVREPVDRLEAAAALERAQQLAPRMLALAADGEIDCRGG